MKRYIARQILIVKLAALVLGTVCFLQTEVHAQEMTGHLVMFPSVGLAPGQTLRLTLFNPTGEPVRVQAQLAHPGGIVVGLGDGSVRFMPYSAKPVMNILTTRYGGDVGDASSF